MSSFATLLAQANPLQGFGGIGGSGELYLGILKSRTVVDAVIKRLDLQNREGKTFILKLPESYVRFDQNSLGKDGTITVSARNKDPKKAAQLANAFVDETIRRSVELYISKAGTERYFLEKRLEAVKVELNNAEDDLKAFQENIKQSRQMPRHCCR